MAGREPRRVRQIDARQGRESIQGKRHCFRVLLGVKTYDVD